MHQKHTRRTFVLAGLLAAIGACSEPATAPSTTAVQPASRFVAALRTGAPVDIPAVDMDLPPQPRPWDSDAGALASAVDAQDGHAIIGFKAVGSARALANGGHRAAIPARVIEAALTMVRARGAEVIEYYDAIGSAHVRMTGALAASLKNHGLVDYIEPRQVRRMFGAPLASSSLSSMMLDQTLPWGMTLVRAPEAWTITRGGNETVEIIDTGHEQGHEDLPYVPSANCAGAFGGCDDGYPIPHGSHVMGILLARDNGVGVVGVANGVSGSNVFSYGACDNGGGCSTPEIVTGINAGIWNARVISMSLGGTSYDPAEANAIASAWSNNIVLVAAAGNNQGQTINYPAGYTNVLGVSGVQPNKAFASTSPCPRQGGGYASSNFGSHVDIAAPFWALSTVPSGYEDETEGWCGTSMATPHVAGAAMLVRAQNPSWTNQDVANQLTSSALDLGTAGRDDYYGHGLLDVAQALGIPRPVPLSVSISGLTTIKTAGFYNWTASASGGSGSYSYSWERKDQGGSYYPAGTGPTYSAYVDNSVMYFDLRATATSGSQSGSATKRVNVVIVQ